MPHWCKISSLYLVPVPNYWTWTKTTGQKKRFFWSNPYKIEVVITSLIEMLQLPDFGHTNTSTIWFESRDKILLLPSSTEIMTSWPLFQNTVILRGPGLAIFADIIKNITRIVKQIFKDSIKAKRIRNYVLKYNLYLYFLIKQNLLIPGEKVLISAEVRECVTWFIYFKNLL